MHLGVLGLNEAQHGEIQRLRHDVLELLPYLRAQRLFTSRNHVASRVNGSIGAAHIVALLTRAHRQTPYRATNPQRRCSAVGTPVYTVFTSLGRLLKYKSDLSLFCLAKGTTRCS